MKHLLLVLSGPSGVGKGTVVKHLLQDGNYALSVSCTTRAPREGEKDGEAYFFISKEEFLNMIENGGLLEYSNHFENYYGTPKKFVEDKLKDYDVILEIEVDGALQAKKSYPDAVLIMLLPPSVEELHNRLEKRHSETEDKIEARMKRMAYEVSKKAEYDYVVINDDLQSTIKEIENIIERERGLK